MKLKPLKEKIIYLKVRQKDKAAFMEAYDAYIEDIYRFIYFKVKSRQDAEDLTSQVFLKSWDHVRNNNLSDYKTLRALFYKVARNSVIDFYRGTKSEEISLDSQDQKFDIKDEKVDIAESLDVKMDMVRLEKVLREMKTEYREVLIMRYINELSIEEIAEILGKSKGNVRVLTYRAIQAAKDIVNNKSENS